MARSVTWTTSQPLPMKFGSYDEMSSAEVCKSILCSTCFCLRTNYYVRYILYTVIMLCWLFSNKLNSIQSATAKIRANAVRFLYDFELQSSAFKDGDPIPSKYNSTLSPPLKWSHPPLLTQSFVLIVEDLDTDHLFKHWIIYNIPSTTYKLSEGNLVWSPDTVILRNDHNRFQYDGPSPRDFQRHHYAFRLFAMDVKKLELPPGTGRLAIASYEDLCMAMEPFILSEATLIGTYDALNYD